MDENLNVAGRPGRAEFLQPEVSNNFFMVGKCKTEDVIKKLNFGHLMARRKIEYSMPGSFFFNYTLDSLYSLSIFGTYPLFFLPGKAL